ncbi:hypothetical protein [Actinomadura luteofluorescens]|uniref:hypothetical protein n=1 Tax=Actinomadura luteofluorescens TaxID=46163 RepID=UPI003D8EF1D4
MKAADLEQALRDDPGDLASWRAYGDRLRERGDARGTLIELRQRRDRTRPADREALDREIAALEDEHRRSWDAGLPEGATVLERRYGFATKVAVEWSDNAPASIEQVVQAPFVTALRIAPSDAQERGDLLWDDDPSEPPWPVPSPYIDTGAFATLDLGRIVELDLSYLRIGAPGAEALAVSTYFRFVASGAGGPGAPAGRGRTEVLDLRYCRVGDAGLAALAASEGFAGVRRLHLQRNLLSAEGVSALHLLTGLVELDLRYNAIGAEGVEALLAAPFIGSLERLLLYRDDVGEAGAKMLADAPHLPPALRSYWRNV